MKTQLAPVHPGEVLLEDAMAPIGLSANRLASHLGIPASRVLEIVNGNRAITADTALRLARFFGTSPQFWMNLQTNYDVKMVEQASGAEIARAVAPRQTAAVSKRLTQ